MNKKKFRKFYLDCLYSKMPCAICYGDNKHKIIVKSKNNSNIYTLKFNNGYLKLYLQQWIGKEDQEHLDPKLLLKDKVSRTTLFMIKARRHINKMPSEN